MKRPWFPVVLFVVMTVLFIWDLTQDFKAGTNVPHIVVEVLMMLTAIAGAVYFWGRLRAAWRHEKELEQDLQAARADALSWQEEERELLLNLNRAISRQFTNWGFTPNEMQIALYLLKGLSMKDIARLKGSTDRSIKQQAYVLYHKAGLAGRAELSAFFLGGLLHADLEAGNATE